MKKLYIIIVALFIGYGAFAQAPTMSWVNVIGAGTNDVAQSICGDPSGNVYVAGNFTGTVDFDPGAGVIQRTATAGTGGDAFIAKYNSAGIYQWVVTFGGAADDAVIGITADATSVYATGYFQGTNINFNPIGVVSLQNSNGLADIFLAKYSSSVGSLTFAKTFGAADTDGGASIVLDGSSNIYITGSFVGSVDFDPSAATTEELAWGDTDMFLAKYTNAGAYLWSADLGSVGQDAGRSCYASGSSVWVSGYFSGTFYPDPLDYSNTIPNVGLKDGYFGQYDGTTGNLLWDGYIRSTGDDVISSLWTDGSSLFTGGYFSSTAVLLGDGGTSKAVDSKGLADAFVARHSVFDKKLQWINGFGGANNEYVNLLTSDGGSVYAIGAFATSMDVDPSATTVTLTNTSGTFDAFQVKYNYILGSHVNSFNVGGNGWDEASSIALSGGYLYWTGIFQNTVDLDPSGLLNSKASAGGYDSFFSRFAPNEPLSSPTGLTFANIGSTTFDVSFAPVGFPDGFLTVFKIGGPPTGVPVDGTAYAQFATIGDAGVLANGPAPAYPVGGGTASTQYFLTVYPYNGSGTTINYKTSSPLSNNVTTATPATEPGFSPTGFSQTLLTTTSYTVSFLAATGSPGGYLAVRATGTTPTTDPIDGMNYTVGGTLGNGTVAFVGGLSATAGATVQFPESGLVGGTQYFYKIYAFNGTAGTINYRTTTPLTGTVTTNSFATEPTAQPTNLVFSNIMSTEFDFSYTASISTSLTGYIVLRATGAQPTFVPVDGTVYIGGSVNAGINGEVITYIGTGTILGYAPGDLSPGTTYYFKVFAYNGSGDQINYLTIAPLSNYVATPLTDPVVQDLTPPTIVDNSATSAAPNTPVKITATITDTGSGLAGAYIDFYPVNSTRSGYLDLVFKSGNTYEATIDASYNTEQGVEYKITATDHADNSSSSPSWKTVVVQYTGDGLTIPYAAGTAQENYRIISIPLNLARKSVTDVFKDDLGDYDKSKYRLFRYSSSTTSELTASSAIEMGKGYWFIAADTKAVDSGEGTTALAGVNTPITIPIVFGWNQIGNPFNIDVDWSLIKNHGDNADKTIGDFKTYAGGFAPATQLKKMSGGFVMIQGAGDNKLRIPAYDDGGRTSDPSLTVNFQQALASNMWGVDILLRSGSTENPFAGFGMHPEASEQNDIYDDFTLPRFMDYLELNYNKKLFGSAFTKDIVPTAMQHVWEFDIASNLPDETVELRWDNSYFGSTDLQLVLWDIEQQRAVDMKSQNTYAFERSRSGAFKIFFGDETFVKAETKPFRPVFHSASPVPSAGNVTFEFSVPESTGDVNTSLVIYNLMGQKMANLLDRPLPAGYQQAIWNIEDGTKPAAGVYISILKFGDTSLQKRLIIR